jgi:hypothetical protein
MGQPRIGGLGKAAYRKRKQGCGTSFSEERISIVKRTRHHQQGYVFRKGSCWYVRYYDTQLDPNGGVERKQKCRKLAKIADCRSKGAAKDLAEEFLKPINDGTITPQSSMSLASFVDCWYLPYVQQQKRLSTYCGYRNMWERYLKVRAEIRLRDFRTLEGERMLCEIAHAEDLSKTTMKHLKSFLSGVFRYARRQGILNSENPMRDVALPKARPAAETYA